MTPNEKMNPERLEELTRQWWETPITDPGDDGYDTEIRAVNAMTEEIHAWPEWAILMRGAMPKWGLEMCAHRWLDGLDDLLRMIGDQAYAPSWAGRCGDVPGRVFAAAEQRAAAVQDWVASCPPRTPLSRQIAEWLGAPDAKKVQAAQCFAEMVRGHLTTWSDQELTAAAERWRALSPSNDVLAELLVPYGLDDLLQNDCGFLLIDRLDLNIRLMGGEKTRAEERLGNCNGQLRLLWQHDPGRYEDTRGYLWGLYAYLRGNDAEWLRARKPECAGASIYAMQTVSRAGNLTPLSRWLVASLLKATKVWCERAVRRSNPHQVPGWALDLPDVQQAIA